MIRRKTQSRSHKMLFSISVLTLICFFVDFIKISETHTDDDGLEHLFRQRSKSDWENAWHRESHSRCREKLVRHLFWACEKDIYRLTRRSDLGDLSKRSQPIPWLEKMDVNNFLLVRRNRRSTTGGSSITAECCTKIGCTWEEYAEYCPSNKRRTHFRN